MRIKDIGIYVLLVAILGFLFVIFKKVNSKNELTESTTKAKKKILPPHAHEDNEENNATAKISLNAVQKQIKTLFDDQSPKTTKQLKALYLEKFKKNIDDVKLNNSIWNMKAAQAIFAEKVGKINYWGLDEWFDEDGLFLEEYADKIPGANETTNI